MTKIETEQRWVCPDCGNLIEDCGFLEVIDVYLCPKCKKPFRTKEKALGCCRK